jgi:two-component system, OmpR family, sensor histidine kinase KdpD
LISSTHHKNRTLDNTETMRRHLFGSVVGVASVLALGLAMLPLRSHISVSTAALVLVIPVVVGSAIGGIKAGISSVIAGFVVYDYAYIPPYKTLDVGTPQNWAALVVYVIVMLLVASVVASLDAARIEAQRASEAARHLSELSEHLVGDRPVDNLLTTIVSAVHEVFGISGVSLLVLEEGVLKVVASAGDPLDDDELAQLGPHSGQPISIGTDTESTGTLRTIALLASGRAVGILVLRGLPTSKNDRAALNTFANDAALALERAQLREQVLRSKLLEEVDRFRQSLMGAVSHDLRTPLATIKVASSTLSNRSMSLSSDQLAELYSLIEVESDRLTRLVSNLLDITRIEAGVFTVHASPSSVAELVREAVSAMEPTLGTHRVDSIVPTALPAVNVDPLLIGQVLINLLDNATRHSPPEGVITVEARRTANQIVLSVTDQGPGVAPENRQAIFERFAQLDKGGRAGLGLTIAKTFVEAHGEEIWYEDGPNHGARFVFSLPLADENVTLR